MFWAESRGGSNEYPQSMFSNEYPQSMFWAESRGGSSEYPQIYVLSRNKKNNVYPCKSQFYYIKVGFKGVNII